MSEWTDPEPLHSAAESGDVARLRDLVTHGWHINALDELGNTPLHYAVENEHYEAALFLIRSGADVNAHDKRSIGDTPLCRSTRTCSPRMAKLLIEHGADPTIRGFMQTNALDRAKRRYTEEGVGSEGQEVYNLLKESLRGRECGGKITTRRKMR